jgi:D-xylose transport system substrate-binding protein
MKSETFAHVLALSVLILTACGAGGSGVTVGKKIALLLPATTAHFDTQDRALFTAKVTQLCSDCQVIYSPAKQDAEQQAQAKTAISSGASVIVLDPIDGAAAAAIVTEAKAANIPVISYDRLVMNTADLGYYVSFDNAAIGALQGTALLTAMGSKTMPTIVELNGDPADKNAMLFMQGTHRVIDGKVHIAQEFSTPGWKQSDAETEMQKALAALGRTKVDGVLAADDTIAAGAIAAIKGLGMNPMPPVTGQGAGLAAIQRIVAGDQYLTVYESIAVEAETAAQLAYDLAFGVTAPQSMTNGKTVNNGTAEIPSVLLAPVVVTKANIESTVVADGFWTAADICTSQYISACAAAGIS